MIDIKKLIQSGNLSTPTSFDGDDYFVMNISGQLVILKVSDSKIPFMVGTKIPSQYLPSYVDEVEEYANVAAFPATGSTSVLYVALDEPTKIYRWGGTAYHVVGGYLELGETSSTAYRGDRGKTAYDFSQGTEVTTEGDLDTVLNGHFYPATTLTVNSQSLLFGFAFGNTSYEGQVIYCDGGLMYVRYKDGGANYGSWQSLATTKLFFTTGNKAIECGADTITIYLDDGTTARAEMTDTDTILYTVDGETAIQIEADRMDLGDAVAGFVGIGIQKVDSLGLIDFVDKTKKATFDLSSITTATTRTLTIPDENGTIATQGWTTTNFANLLSGYVDMKLCTSLEVYETALPAGTLVGTTYTASANGVLVIDSTTVASDFVLINNRLISVDAALWEVTSLGSAGTPFILEYLSTPLNIINQANSASNLDSVYVFGSSADNLTLSYQCVNSSIESGYISVSSNHTVTSLDTIIVVTSLATITLPTAVGLTGKTYTIKTTYSGTVTVDTTDSQTIDGVATASLTQYDSITIVSDGSNWLII